MTILFCAAVALPSCSKSPENIGVDFQPDDDYVNLQYTDTVELNCYSVVADSIGTTCVSPLLGSIMDPVFGLTSAGFYTQIHISSQTPAFDTASAAIDSVVLLLSMNGFYGDTTTMLTFNVFEMADSITSSTDVQYYSNTTINCKDLDLAAAYQVAPRPKTKDTTGAAILRIPLSHDADEIVQRVEANFSNDEVREVFYGLHITAAPVSSGGSIVGINITDNSKTVMRVYYRDKEDLDKQLIYDFYVTSKDVFFNSFAHDYSYGSSSFKQQVLDGDTAMGSQELFVQAMGGVRTFIAMPNLDKWDAGEGRHIVINEARLVITGTATDTMTYKAPSALALVMIDDDGTLITLPDISEGSSYYGGTYNSGNNSVMFRISEYVQNIVSGKKQNNGIWLSVSGASYVASRWVVAGSGDESKGIHLEVKYSTLGE